MWYDIVFICDREANQLSEEMKRDTEFAVTLQVWIFVEKILQQNYYPLIAVCVLIDPYIWSEFKPKSCCLRQRGRHCGEAEEQGNAM